METNNFNSKILKLHSMLKSYAISLSIRPEDADDLIQETYLKALSNRNKYKNHTNLKAWIFTIMRNTFINNYRRQKHSNTFIDKTDEKFFINQTNHTGFNSTESMINENEIQKKINLLNDDFKTAFTLFTKGFKYKEIAIKMNIPIGTVKSRIFFSRKKLSMELNDYIN